MSAYWISIFIFIEEVCEGVALPATSPLHISRPSPKTSRPHDLSSSFYPVCMPSELCLVIFTGSLFSAGHRTSFSSNTCSGLWLWSIPAGCVLSVGDVTGHMWKFTHLHWRNGQINLDKMQRAIQSHSKVREWMPGAAWELCERSGKLSAPSLPRAE